MNDLDTAFSVRDRVVLVTGAGRGIGRGIVRVFASAGAKVAVNALTERTAGPLVRAVNEQDGHAVLALGDVTCPAGADAVIAHTLEYFGKIDVLINNLGDSISRPVTDLEGMPGMSDEEWKAIMDVNLTHVFYCCRGVGRGMLKQGHGKVINISSFAAARGGARTAAYSGAKAAVLALTRALALEWAPTIPVNAIAPGVFPDEEDMTPDELRHRDSEAGSRVPLERVGRPREVGYLALYLASAASDYMTGQTLFLDGGLTVK